MAKRFIQHELLRNPWLRAASTLEKLLWVGLITECDHAGIWIVDWQMMELMVGGKIDPGAAKKFLNGRFLEVDNGRRWFLPDFIRFQYPQGVSTNNNTMKSVRQILDNYGIDTENLTIREGLGTLIGYWSQNIAGRRLIGMKINSEMQLKSPRPS